MTGKTIWSRDGQPVLATLQREATGTVLTLETTHFTVRLPATKHVLELLARKLKSVAKA